MFVSKDYEQGQRDRGNGKQMPKNPSDDYQKGWNSPPQKK